MLQSRPRMSDAAPNLTSAPSDLAWRVIGLTNLYRLLLPPGLLLLQVLSSPGILVRADEPVLFQVVCYAYLVAGGLLILARRVPRPSLRILALVNASVDTLAISLILYASGGVGSGLGILLVFPVGAMALLGRTKDAFLVPAIATLGVLTQQIAADLVGYAPTTDYTTAGMLGVVMFVIGLSVWPVADRLRQSEALVRRQEIDLANLEQLSHYIVQHLRESILVVDVEDQIRLINESAAALLGAAQAFPGALLGEASPRLLYLLETWRQRKDGLSSATETLVSADGARMLRPHFAALGNSQPAAVLVFLEDMSLIAEQAQRLKLAALGRLSASIAHEIRNPVGAMSHAGQLLSESPQLAPEDRRLTDIIGKNAERVSDIINNVLQLSRRESTQTETFELSSWIDEFRDEFCETMEWPPEQLLSINVEVSGASPTGSYPALALTEGGQNGGLVLPKGMQVTADPTQLRQVVWNLCDNAIKYGLRNRTTDVIEIRYGRLRPAARPFLEVADRGPGVRPEDAERIFEPFYSGEHRGSGLGLFLARELAQTSGATLLYEPRPAGGSIFRLVFADPLRWAVR
ncbi:MAG TPA: HAMP domain-containing sensor histidine kinase [Steroidobacteraceae bacterium]|nr:HAMP domain-containing sensor histidine kinase [Steroidobacteraceae bacterium]